MNNWIYKLERRYGRFAIPNLMLYITGTMLVVFLLTYFTGCNIGAVLDLRRSAVLSGQVWRLISFVFVPSISGVLGTLLYLYFNYAIGTALAQASIYEACRQQTEDRQEMIALTAANLTFLQGRILEDYFYLKDDIELVNQNLKKAGYTNTADLDLTHNYRWANHMLQSSMQQHVASYKQTKSARIPVKFTSPAGDFSLMMQDLTIELSYPWPRTFEIWLHAMPSFAIPTDK